MQEDLGATLLDSGISDDPKTWKVPNRAVQFDSVMEWWQHLRDAEEDVRSALDGATDAEVDRCMFVIEQLRIALSDPHASTHKTEAAARASRPLVRELLGDFKLSPEQVLGAIGHNTFTRAAVASMLSANGRRSDDEAKARAIEMLQGGSYTAAIAEETGLNYEQIRYLANTLGIDRKLSKDHIVAEAHRLFDEGQMKVVDIHRHLQTLPGGEHVKLNTVYQWRQRAKRPPEQRERVLQLIAEGVPYPTIAEQTTVPLGTVKAWASRYGKEVAA